MAQSVLTHTGNIVPRRSLRRLTMAEEQMDSEKAKRAQFDAKIKLLLGDSLTLPPKPDTYIYDELDFDPRDSDKDEHVGWMDGDPLNDISNPIFEHSGSDTFVNAEVLLPLGEDLKKAKVCGRHVGDTGQMTVEYNINPLLNSILYDVDFGDGAIKQYTANTIAQNIHSMVDKDGRAQLVLDSIMDHAKDDRAIDKADKYIITGKGRKRLRKTTIGWKILVRWKDGREQWVLLKLMKYNYPVEMAEYAKGNQIDDEPAFQWWVSYTLKKRDTIISVVKARMRNNLIKYCIKVSRSMREAKLFDEDNENTAWQDEIDLEMATIMPGY